MNVLLRWYFLALSFVMNWGALTLDATAGTAMLFDGMNDVVSVAGFGNVVPTDEVTIEFWQRVDRVKSQAPFILNPDQGPNRFLASTPYSDSRVYLDYGNYTNRGRLSYAPSMTLTGSWQHFAIAVSVSGGFMRIYRNGVLEASTNTTSFYTPFAATLLLGGSATYRFGGMLDEFRIWNTVRSASQVRSNMNRALTGGESNLVAYWNFEEGAGIVVADASGNGRNGTAARSNAWVFSTAPIGAPVATTLNAVNVSANSATLTGTVFTANQTTRAWFEYGTSAAYGAVSATNTLSSATNNVPVARVLNGLTANTTYHFRLVSTNGGGTNAGSGLTVTTPAARPAVTTLAANAITATGARLRAAVNPNGLAAAAWFEYGLNTNYGTIAGLTNLGVGVNNITFSNVVANLLPGRAYQFRIVATNGMGTNFGANQSFTTPPAAPLVNTMGTDAVGATSARLVGTVNPNGAATRFFFQYGLTTNYGSVTTATNLTAGNLSLSLTGVVASLLPGNLYHFRAMATNVAGTNLGTDLSFTTSPLRPLVTTLAATGVTTNSAVVNASVNPNGAATDVYFEYGATTNYDGITPAINLMSGNALVAVSNLVSALAPGTPFHVRAVATNSAGASFGVDQSFTTTALAAPAITGYSMQTNGALHLTFSGSAGGAYSVMTSTNLTNWAVLGTPVENPPGAFQFSDTNAPGYVSRFYRLRSP